MLCIARSAARETLFLVLSTPVLPPCCRDLPLTLGAGPAAARGVASPKIRRQQRRRCPGCPEVKAKLKRINHLRPNVAQRIIGGKAAGKAIPARKAAPASAAPAAQRSRVG